MPRLAAFKTAHPAVAIELETNHRGVDPDRRDFDAWFAYTGETAAPRPLTCREATLLEETLYEEDLLPVCSPALLAALARPAGPAGLDGWPLLYDLGWDADWSYWFARQGEPTPDLSRASGFRLYSMLIQAAVHGIGATIRRPMLIARELEDRTLVRVFDRQVKAPEPLLSHHHRRLPAAARGPGVPGVGSRRGAGGGRRRGAPSVRWQPWHFREPRGKPVRAGARRRGLGAATQTEVRLHRPGHEYDAGAARLRHNQRDGDVGDNVVRAQWKNKQNAKNQQLTEDAGVTGMNQGPPSADRTHGQPPRRDGDRPSSPWPYK